MRKLMAKDSVIVANGVLGCKVDERSVFGVGEAGFVIDRLARVAVVSSLQVPHYSPKKTAARLSLFLQAEP